MKKFGKITSATNSQEASDKIPELLTEHVLEDIKGSWLLKFVDSMKHHLIFVLKIQSEPALQPISNVQNFCEAWKLRKLV